MLRFIFLSLILLQTYPLKGETDTAELPLNEIALDSDEENATHETATLGETLQKIINEALAEYSLVKMQEFSVESLQHLVKKEKLNYLPQATLIYTLGKEYAKNSSTISFFGGGSRFRKEIKTLQINQLLYDGGKRPSLLRQARSNLRFSQAQLKEAKEDISLQISEICLNILLYQGLIQEKINFIQILEDFDGKIKKALRKEGGNLLKNFS